MKIEPSKTNQTDKRTSSAEKPSNSFQPSFQPTEKLDSPPPGAFAKILEEARTQGQKDEHSSAGRRENHSDRKAETSETKDEKTGKDIRDQEKTEEKNRKRGSDKENSEEKNDHPVFASADFQIASKRAPEIAPPAARSILHVADLERIVSSIRAHNLKNLQAVIITLKHSVLEGLQIKFAMDENGKFKAEFLALNEQIKNHLTARKQEISVIFSERGIKLSDFNIQQGSEFSQQQNQTEEDSRNSKSSGREIKTTVEKDDSDQKTSYRV